MLALFACLLLALPLADADAANRDAIGCPGPPCVGWSSLSPILTGSIPADGVFLFEAVGEGGPPLSDIALTVTQGGTPVAGAVQATPIPTLFLWRPTDPWTPGMSYQANVSALSSCSGVDLGFVDTVVVDAAPGEALAEPTFTAATSVQVAPDTSLDSLVCCEGATPTLSSGCNGSGLYWDPAQCTSTAAQGLVVAEVTASAVAGGATAAQVFYTVKVDGQAQGHSRTPNFYASSGAPMCIELIATYLGTGTSSTSARQCFGDDVTDQLGPQVLDPTEVLACDLQQCTNTGDGTLACHGVEPSPSSDTLTMTDEDEGCGCDTNAPMGAYSLAWLALLVLARRRRSPA